MEITIYQENTQHIGKYMASVGKKATSKVYAVVAQHQADQKGRPVQGIQNTDDS